MRKKPFRFFGKSLPGVKTEDLKGHLFVIEGPDGSGRSTYIRILTDWLEASGYSTINVGLRRSTLLSREIEQAKMGNTLDERTFTLFYITDFFDQLENIIIPNLKAGCVILADRYIYTLIARSVVRGLSSQWVENICEVALVPDLVFHLKVTLNILTERNLQKYTHFDWWESGMDMRLSSEIFTSFRKYQRLMQKEYERMATKYGFTTINANRSSRSVSNELKMHIENYIANSER
jgi:dTMP kinase